MVEWALREVGIEEWIIRVVMAMYENDKCCQDQCCEAFNVKFGAHQGCFKGKRRFGKKKFFFLL